MIKIFQTAKILLLAIVLSFGLSYVYAWTAPTATPPNGNVAAPINTGSINQVKTGGLTVDVATSTVYKDANDASFFLNPNGDSKLKALYMTDAVNSLVSSPKFCLSTNGTKCITDWPTASASGVTKIIAGAGITVTPTTGTGTVTVGSSTTAGSSSVVGYGGSYYTNRHSTASTESCSRANIATGTCACPSGYTAVIVLSSSSSVTTGSTYIRTAYVCEKYPI